MEFNCASKPCSLHIQHVRKQIGILSHDWRPECPRVKVTWRNFPYVQHSFIRPMLNAWKARLELAQGQKVWSQELPISLFLIEFSCLTRTITLHDSIVSGKWFYVNVTCSSIIILWKKYLCYWFSTWTLFEVCNLYLLEYCNVHLPADLRWILQTFFSL